jgi:ankyrin repeat protein
MSDDANSDLWTAAKVGDNEALLRALERGANVNAVGRDSPLRVAAVYGHASTIQLLVQHGADINALNSLGVSALQHACAYGQVGAVKQLLGLGARPDVCESGSSPLLIAVSNNCCEVTRVLVEAGVDVKIRLQDGAALELALRRGSAEMIALLKKAVRRQEAHSLLNWMLAMQPLQLPICEIFCCFDLRR